MPKYLGSWQKKARALGFSLRRNKQEFSRGKKRTTPPGIQGGKRKKKSPYADKLREKQRVKNNYGLRDYQLKNKYVEARIKSGDTATNLLTRLESRLDNLVFRSGLINTLPFARQWVVHGHFLVNGKKVKSPDWQVKPGQIIGLRKEKMHENKLIKGNLEKNTKLPPFLDLNKQKLNITYLRYPAMEELDEGINTSLVMEWYDKKV